jgi:4-amino-4-deoxy-L-arabinose transferase-like glycosyltransferase
MIVFAKWKDSSWLAPTLVFLLALILFSINLDRPPIPDELHHILAAQQLLDTGRPIIDKGEYWRVIHWTWLVAISYEIFGEGLASARLPSVLLVALIAPILFLWVRREAGILAAWITAILFISSPFTVEIAQFSRFYSLQGLSFVLGVLCWYYGMVAAQSLGRRVLLVALAFGMFSLAVSAQVTTYVGLVGVALWTFGLVVHRVYFVPKDNVLVKKAMTAGLVVCGILMVAVIALTDVLQWAWYRHQATSLFNVARQGEFWFYYLRFLLFYPTLWTLVGILALLAVVRSPRLAWLAISVFAISFLLMSIAGSKATRYISYAPPFLAIVWGIGLANALTLVSRVARESYARLVATLALPGRLSSVVGKVLILLALLIVVLSNPFWLRTGAMIGNIALPFENPTTNWRVAREALAPWVHGADIMITTEELGSLYFLGRSDVRFSPSKIRELAPDQRREFGIDYRTGRPVITKPESLEALIACFPSGFVVGPIEDWGRPILISEEIQAVIIRHSKPIQVPEESYLYAWGWERERTDNISSTCSDLERFSGRHAGRTPSK